MVISDGGVVFRVMLVMRNFLLTTSFLEFFTDTSPYAGSLDPETTLDKDKDQAQGAMA